MGKIPLHFFLCKASPSSSILSYAPTKALQAHPLSLDLQSPDHEEIVNNLWQINI